MSAPRATPRLPGGLSLVVELHGPRWPGLHLCPWPFAVELCCILGSVSVLGWSLRARRAQARDTLRAIRDEVAP